MRLDRALLAACVVTISTIGAACGHSSDALPAETPPNDAGGDADAGPPLTEGDCNRCFRICPCSPGETFAITGCAPTVCTSGQWQLDCEGTACVDAGPPDASPDVYSGPPCNDLVSSCTCTAGETYSCFPYDGRTYTCDGGTWGPLCEAADASDDAADD